MSDVYANVMGTLSFVELDGKTMVMHDSYFDEDEVDILIAGRVWVSLNKTQTLELLNGLKAIEGDL